MGFPIIQAVRRDGRVVECTGLENRQGFIAPLGFKSLSLHHLIKNNYEYTLTCSLCTFGEMAEWSNAPVLKTGRGL